MITLTDEELAKGREIYGDCRCEYPIMTDSEWESELYRMIVLDKHLTEELRKEIDKEIEKREILMNGNPMKDVPTYRAIEIPNNNFAYQSIDAEAELTAMLEQELMKKYLVIWIQEYDNTHIWAIITSDVLEQYKDYFFISHISYNNISAITGKPYILDKIATKYNTVYYHELLTAEDKKQYIEKLNKYRDKPIMQSFDEYMSDDADIICTFTYTEFEKINNFPIMSNSLAKPKKSK